MLDNFAGVELGYEEVDTNGGTSVRLQDNRIEGYYLIVQVDTITFNPVVCTSPDESII